MMRRLSRAGFQGDFVRQAVIPDWWDEACARQPDLMPEIEIRVSRFLGVSLEGVKDPSVPLAPQQYPNAQLRRVRDIDRDRLAPAIHAALRIASAVVRSLRESAAIGTPLPLDPYAWREDIAPGGGHVSLESVIADLWSRGIPVVPLEILPAPSFQGVACVVAERPVILLGHRHDEPGRVAFLVAHEAGHVAAGDCQADQPVVDEEDEVLDESDIERRADAYATGLVVGRREPPSVDAADFRQLANGAAQLERATGVDAGLIAFAWAARTGDYATAAMAVRALYRNVGARRLLRKYFDRYVDLGAANETDRDLLRCVAGDPERDGTPR